MRYIRRTHKFSRQSKEAFYEITQSVTAKNGIYVWAAATCCCTKANYSKWWWRCHGFWNAFCNWEMMTLMMMRFLCVDANDDYYKRQHFHYFVLLSLRPSRWRWRPLPLKWMRNNYYVKMVSSTIRVLSARAGASAMTDDEWKYALHMLTQWSEGRGRRKLKDGLAQFWK